MRLLLATAEWVLAIDPVDGRIERASDLAGRRPTCLAAERLPPGRAWCGTATDGVWRSDDGGRSWRTSGLEGQRITAIAASPARAGRVWAGTEPSALWRSDDAGATWRPTRPLEELPSSPQWSFPPRPETHHVRWIACHPADPGRLWLAIEAGALVTTPDGGDTWHDRVAGGPYDTHELAIHPDRPELLRVAAGDGWFESEDGGRSWRSPIDGLDVDYLRSVAIDPGDPETVVVSAASHPHRAYVTGLSDGRLYRREGRGPWQRVRAGWPDPPRTIAPLLAAGREPGELWAADERGVHRSADGGQRWEQVAGLDRAPSGLRGLAIGG